LARDKDGYGVLTLQRPHRTQRASRYAHEAFNGPIPEGMIVLHSCDNSCCVNPDHLSTGTHTDNVQDCRSKGRLADTKGEKHGGAKLTAEIIRSIRAWTGTQALCARRFGIAQQTVSNIKRRLRWTHVE
jgi:hypothetical protein